MRATRIPHAASLVTFAMLVTGVTLAAGVTLAGCGPNRGDGGDDGGDDAPGDPDAGGPDAPVTPPPPEHAAVYAHSATRLYRIDPETFAVAEVGPFQWPQGIGSDQMTDLAIDKDGLMIGVSFSRVYRIDPDTAAATLLSSSLAGNFNGLSFVPAGQVGLPEGPDVLVGSRNTDGKIFSIDPMTGAAAEVGDMGGGWRSSGDIVSVYGFGTVATVTRGTGGDTLARLAPGTFAATPIGVDTGYSQLWGIGFWGDKVFGFAESGAFVLIDTTTGVATPVETAMPRWWGAAVTTAAPVID